MATTAKVSIIHFLIRQQQVWTCMPFSLPSDHHAKGRQKPRDAVSTQVSVYS